MQLPLAIAFPDTATLDSFNPGPNGLLLELLHRCANLQGEPQLYCWGDAGLGKTHLLQATCRAASENGYSSCYLPVSELLEYGPQSLDGLEAVRLLALDEVDRLAGRDEWERALFSLINRCRAAGGCLLLAARANIGELAWALPDLVSRLAWGPVFQVRPLTDAGKLDVLQARARRRGIELNDEVGRYLLTRYPRDMRYLCEQLDTLDRASLAAQRRLTIPFIKEVLNQGKGENQGKD
jgi:DnaA family protein